MHIAYNDFITVLDGENGDTISGRVTWCGGTDDIAFVRLHGNEEMLVLAEESSLTLTNHVAAGTVFSYADV